MLPNIPEETKKILRKIGVDFDEISQKIVEGNYLKSFEQNELSCKDNLYDLPIEREIHGGQHVSRVAAYIEVLINFCKRIGYPQEIIALSYEEIILLKLAALFHDSGRAGDGKDIWEKFSAEKFCLFLIEQNIPEELASIFASYITHSKDDYLDTLLQSSDAVDCMRVRRTFQLNRVDIFFKLKENYGLVFNDEHKADFYQLISEIRDLLLLQGDLKFETEVWEGENLILGPLKIPTSYQGYAIQQRKHEYEHAENCYKRTVEDFKQFPMLNTLYNSKTITSNLDEEKIPELNRLLVRQQIREKIREEATRVNILGHQRYFIKLLRADEYNSLREVFIPNHIHSPEPRVLKQPLRTAPKKKFTLTGLGIFRRKQFAFDDDEMHIPSKENQHEPSTKQGYSKFHSTTIGTSTHTPDILQFQDTDRKKVGIVFEQNNVLLSNRLYKQSCGSIRRPHDFLTIKEAEEYKEKATNTLFPSAEIDELEKQLTDSSEVNEALVRTHLFFDGSIRVFINSDTLAARLTAQDYVRLLTTKLPDYHFPKGREIPIIYYCPQSPALHLKTYGQQEQALDRQEATELYNDLSLRHQCYTDNNFEILLALPPEKIKRLFKEKWRRQNIILAILASGQVHIVQSLLEIVACDIAEIFPLEELQDSENKALISQALYHCIRKQDDNLAPFIFNNANLEKLDYPIENHKNKQLIHLVAEQGLISWLKLIHTKIDVNAKDKNNNTALMYAIENGHTDMAAELLKLKISFTKPNNFGKTPLATALELGLYEIVDMLFMHGLDATTVDAMKPPIMIALAAKGHHEAIDLLLKHKVSPHSKSQWSQTPLFAATKYGHSKVVTLLLKESSCHVLFYDKQPLLNFAVISGDVNTVNAFLELTKVDINALDKYNKTALYHAVVNNEPAIVKTLLEHQADPNIFDHDFSSPLDQAIYNHNDEIQKLLIEYGAQQNLNWSNIILL